MTAEHRTLRRDDPRLASAYTNCLYACRLCNMARGTKPLETHEGRLLDPTTDPWANHFTTVDSSRLQPKAGDSDARYTFNTYDLDNPSKTSRRQARWELLTDRQTLRARIGAELTTLLDLVGLVQKRNPKEYAKLWQEISDLRRQALRALRDLEIYRAVPSDAPETCRCTSPHELTLPSWLDQQCSEIG